MTPILALTLGGPLMLIFGIMVALVVGSAGGYVLGTSIGKTRPETPLPTTIRLTREQLASTCTHLEKASGKLNNAERSERAGAALVLERRLSELSSSLGTIGHKAKRSKGGSA